MCSSLPPSLPLRLQKLENLAQSILASCATISVSLETLEQEVEEFETSCTSLPPQTVQENAATIRDKLQVSHTPSNHLIDSTVESVVVYQYWTFKLCYELILMQVVTRCVFVTAVEVGEAVGRDGQWRRGVGGGKLPQSGHGQKQVTVFFFYCGTSDNGHSEEWTTSLQWTSCSPPAFIIVHTFLPPKKGQPQNKMFTLPKYCLYIC